jgi:hypothetical protein
MSKRVLMIAFHFPPLRGSSGIQRTLKFARYLPQQGWQPLVLSAHPRAYVDTSDDQLAEIAPEAVVKRAFALDAARHLSLRGRYLGWTALPDRWVSWCLGAIPAGLAMIRRHRPQAIWSTYPIASAHLIALVLARLSGLPWIADMRDPMTDVDYPANPLQRRFYLWLEAQTLRRCTLAVCVTPGALADYQARFPELPRARLALIENGYDEDNFASAGDVSVTPRKPGEPFTLLHSGIIYPSERDPVPLFEALAALQADGRLQPGQLRVLLRATAHDDYLAPVIERLGIGNLVQLAPPVPYRAALAEMLAADGLLILQAGNCNRQVPAKLYEYLRAQRPILALTDAAGDTAAVLRGAGVDTVAALDDRAAIEAALLRFLALAAAGQAPLAPPAAVASASRRGRTVQLAQLLDQITRPQVAAHSMQSGTEEV